MVYQYRAFWTIPNAGPSVSTFHGVANTPSTAQLFADNIREFFDGLASKLPDEVSVTFDTEVIELDTALGTLVGVQAVTAPLTVDGTGTGVWAAGVGARVVWGTSNIVGGRRVRGSTFLVPLAANQYDTSGQILSASIAGITATAELLLSDNLAAGTPLQVYSRPIPGRPGTTSVVEAASVPSVVATLRGRKY